MKRADLVSLRDSRARGGTVPEAGRTETPLPQKRRGCGENGTIDRKPGGISARLPHHRLARRRRCSTSLLFPRPPLPIAASVLTSRPRATSLPTQEESCRRYCAEHGYTLSASFPTPTPAPNWTGPVSTPPSTPSPPLKPAVVVLHDVDRLGREFIVQAIAERELTRHGARIEYVLGGDTDAGDGILLKGVKQALAVYENYQRVERSRRGKNGRVKAGGVLVAARPAYGYRYVAGERTGTLEPHPDEAPDRAADLPLVRR